MPCLFFGFNIIFRPKIDIYWKWIPIIKPGLNPLLELPDPATFDIIVIDMLEQLVTQAEEKDAIVFLQRVGDMHQ